MAPPITLVQTKALVRLRSISSRQRSTDMSRIGVGSRRPPTLLIRMSNGPCAASARPQAVSQIAGIAHVGLDGPGLPAERADVRRRSLEARRVAAGERDVGACVGDRERHLAPEPAAAAGDEEPPAGQANRSSTLILAP